MTSGITYHADGGHHAHEGDDLGDLHLDDSSWSARSMLWKMFGLVNFTCDARNSNDLMICRVDEEYLSRASGCRMIDQCLGEEKMCVRKKRGLSESK